jgi:acyl-CoA dehydrogenase
VRKQFGLSIGRFEGIEEPLARIGAKAWMLEAARRYTCGAIDSGVKPAVVTAMAKYAATELFRQSVNDAMDVVGGAGISRGPRNLLAQAYIGAPIGVTVEGANILTRTLMIFGQGAIRCHPYAYDEIAAVANDDVAAFDRAFFGHVGHVVRNGCRSLVLSVTRGALASSPVDGPLAPYLKKLSWASASFAFLADLSMGLLGGDLKRREKVAGRFSDAFCWMYLASAAARRFEAEGRREEDLPFLHWSMRHALARIQDAFDGLYANLALPGIGWLLRGPVALWSRLDSLSAEPSDRLGARVAQALQTPGAQRDGLTAMVHVPLDPEEALGRLERAFALCVQADDVSKKLREAVKAKKLPREKPLALLDRAVEAGVITAAERELVHEAEVARDDAIQVDSFTLDEYLGHAAPSVDSARAVRAS